MPAPPLAGGVAALWIGSATGAGAPWLSYRITPGADLQSDAWLIESGATARVVFSCRPSASTDGLRLASCSGLPEGVEFSALVPTGTITIEVTTARAGSRGPLVTRGTLMPVLERDEPRASANVTLLRHHQAGAEFGPYTDVWADGGVVFAPHGGGGIELLDAASGERVGLIDFRPSAAANPDPDTPCLVCQVGATTAYVTAVKARDGVLYAATTSAGLLIFDVSDPAKVQLLGQLSHAATGGSPERFVNIHNIALGRPATCSTPSTSRTRAATCG